MKNLKNIHLFFILLILMLINTLLVSELITDELMQNTYSGQLSADMIGKMLKMQRQYWWVSYVMMPVILFLKLSLSASCVWIGTVFNGLEQKFKSIWRIFLLAEFVFIVQMIIKTTLLYFMDIETMDDINNFIPLSLYSLLDIESIPSYLRYPSALFNVFEVIYWFVLAYLLRPKLNSKFSTSLFFVFKTYGLGLLIWMSLMVFLTLNFAA